MGALDAMNFAQPVVDRVAQIWLDETRFQKVDDCWRFFYGLLADFVVAEAWVHGRTGHIEIGVAAGFPSRSTPSGGHRL